MRLLCGEPESQETHAESLQYIHNKATTGAWNGNVWGQHRGGYFKQLCLYLQNDETFDHCSRNNRVSEFRGHVVLVNDTKSAGQLQNDAKAEHPTGGVQCAEEFEVENREGAPFNRRTLVWHGWLQLQVESRTWRWRWRLPVPRTRI